VNKSDLEELLGTLPKGRMGTVDAAVRWFLELD